MHRALALRILTLVFLLLGVASCYVSVEDDHFVAPTDSCDWGVRGNTCAWPSDPPGPAFPNAPDAARPESCETGIIEPHRSLIIDDPVSLLGPATSNAIDDAPYSFRGQLLALTSTELGARELMKDWFAQFRALDRVSFPAHPQGFVPVNPRPEVTTRLECPWWKLSDANDCNWDCSFCQYTDLDLKKSPFSLIAIVNRIDLAKDPFACNKDAGEVRLVYTAVEPGTHRALPFTVIFKYQVILDEGEDRRSYARKWQRLSELSSDSVAESLDAFLAPTLARSRLLRVRTNEQAFDMKTHAWELRQFEPVSVGTDAARFVQTIVPETPSLSHDNTPALTSLINQSGAPILDGLNHLPPEMATATSVIPFQAFSWSAVGADTVLKNAFNRNTCNGCHGALARSNIEFQHIGPGNMADVTSAPAALSGFLESPGGDDELAHRRLGLESMLCAPCAPSAPESDAGAPSDCGTDQDAGVPPSGEDDGPSWGAGDAGYVPLSSDTDR